MMPLLLALAGALLVGGLLLALYAILLEPYLPRLRRVELEVPADWPALTILHLSDLHVRSGGERLYRVQSRFLRSLSPAPDLVCVTGDVCEELEDAPRVAELLDLVRPRLETLVVLGNHEHHAPMPAQVECTTHRGWGRLAKLTWGLLGSRRHSSGSVEAHAI